MNKEIQPKYQKAKVVCSTCGNTFEVGSTISEIKVDTCYNCHQFYTGAQSQAQATGRVEIFNKKMAVGAKAQKDLEKRNKAKEEKETKVAPKKEVTKKETQTKKTATKTASKKTSK